MHCYWPGTSKTIGQALFTHPGLSAEWLEAGLKLHQVRSEGLSLPRLHPETAPSARLAGGQPSTTPSDPAGHAIQPSVLLCSCY